MTEITEISAAGAKKRRILVTGATGLIGRSVVAELSAGDGYEIVALGGRQA